MQTITSIVRSALSKTEQKIELCPTQEKTQVWQLAAFQPAHCCHTVRALADLLHTLSTALVTVIFNIQQLQANHFSDYLAASEHPDFNIVVLKAIHGLEPALISNLRQILHFQHPSL